jgi:hypothetical protein
MLGVAGVQQASGSHFEGATSLYRVECLLSWVLRNGN